MHIKFTKAGSGDARKLARYLTAEKDSAGVVRDQVIILQGDPNEVAELANSLPFKHRFTHGIHAFGAEDRVTLQEVKDYAEDLKKAAYADLDDSDHAFAFVVHLDNKSGDIHLHTFDAKIHLSTNKQFNVAEPHWEQHFDLLRDTWNYEKNWARPDDPARKRLFSKDYEHSLDAANERIKVGELKGEIGLKPSRKGLRTLLDRFAEQTLVSGGNTREDLINAFKNEGLEINRAGKNYISVIAPESKTTVRLNGAAYEENFNFEDFKDERKRLADHRKNDPGAAEKGRALGAEKRRELVKSTARRAERHAERFRNVSKKHSVRDQFRHKKVIEQSNGAEQRLGHIEQQRRSALKDPQEHQDANPGHRAAEQEKLENTHDNDVHSDFAGHNDFMDRHFSNSRIENGRDSHNKEIENKTYSDSERYKPEIKLFINVESKNHEKKNSFRESLNERFREFNKLIRSRYEALRSTIQRNADSIRSVKQNAIEALSTTRRAVENNISTIENDSRSEADYREIIENIDHSREELDTASRGLAERLQTHFRELPWCDDLGEENQLRTNDTDAQEREKIEIAKIMKSGTRDLSKFIERENRKNQKFEI
jgi:ElaB/YqjD/DUF883 family membrane-anchored ribosome-binding protein